MNAIYSDVWKSTLINDTLSLIILMQDEHKDIY